MGSVSAWKLVLVFGLAGATWMALVLLVGSPHLAVVSNYPGMFAARWVHYRGIAPSSKVVWMFNGWLVVTSALEWIGVGVLGYMIARRF